MHVLWFLCGTNHTKKHLWEKCLWTQNVHWSVLVVRRGICKDSYYWCSILYFHFFFLSKVHSLSYVIMEVGSGSIPCLYFYVLLLGNKFSKDLFLIFLLEAEKCFYLLPIISLLKTTVLKKRLKAEESASNTWIHLKTSYYHYSY